MNRKKKILAALCITTIVASGLALAGRSHHREYAYFDAQGGTIGYATYPCYGPVILDGDTSGIAVLEFEC
jgi:hypothetical protein